MKCLCKIWKKNVKISAKLYATLCKISDIKVRILWILTAQNDIGTKFKMRKENWWLWKFLSVNFFLVVQTPSRLLNSNLISIQCLNVFTIMFASDLHCRRQSFTWGSFSRMNASSFITSSM